MPLYEYLCLSCRIRFEALVSMGKEGEAVCPDCGGRKLRKCFSSFGIGGGAGRTSGNNCTSCRSGNCATCR